MGADGKLRKLINNRGLAIVYLALLLVVLLGIVGLAVDIGYMYVAKGQLQNAADAAALAAATKLTQAGTSDLVQANARAEAITFAGKNVAAKVSVAILNDNTNTLNSGNDITVGLWNGTTYTSNTTPVNAVQVRTRRTSDSPGGQVAVFFGKILGWTQMSATAQAVATRPVRATAPIALCIQACMAADGVPYDMPGGKLYYWAPYPSEAIPGSQGVAWTVFSETSQSMDKDAVISYFCGNDTDICNKTIYSTNGNANDLSRQFRCAFKNPNYDVQNKVIVGGVVQSWLVTVPVFENAGCPPGGPPNPYLVVSYANIRIIDVYASGGGGTNKCACDAFDASVTTGSYPNAILVDQITCNSCGTPGSIGNRAALVQ